MLDTRYRVEIPGGIKLEAQVVGPIPRFFALAIDLTIRGVLFFLLSLAMIPFAALGAAELGGGLYLILLFLMEWFYPVLFEVLWRGQTPGKRVLGISVINDDLTPVTLGPSLVRNLLRVIDFLPLMYLAGLVCMLSNRRFQRLGDLAAGTLVISVRETAKPAAIENIEPLAPSTALLRSEQTSIIDFLHRSRQLSEPRQHELAAILDGVTHEPSENGVDKLHRIGAWFLGVR
ncbi:MAG: RDD family protein [Gammaproteobacteria bacterium]|nr:RDD family protein [Gammaproteobacteria bacterium]